MTLNQIERWMEFALCAMAIRFTATAGTVGEGAAEKPVGGTQLGDARTERPFGIREAGAMEGDVRVNFHLRYQVYLRLENKTMGKMK